ncbi:MAG: hypothetical protein V3S55_13830 [Nitrospiraceae bacterium]
MGSALGSAVAAMRNRPPQPKPARKPPDIRTGITFGEEIEDGWVDAPEEEAQAVAQAEAGGWADVPTPEPRRGPLEHVSRAYGEATIGAPTLGQAISQFAEGAPYMARHPIESAKMLGRGILESHAEAAAVAKRQMARPELAHKIVGGLRYGVSGIPIIGPAFVQAGEQTAEREGGYWKALGTTLGAATWLATAIAGKPVVRGYEKLAARMEKAPVEISIPKPGMAKQPPTPHKAAQITRQEALTAAESRGIDLTAAEATKEPLLETIEWVGKKALVGNEELLARSERSRAGVQKWAEDIRAKTDPHQRGATEEAAGTDIRQSMQISEQVARENVRKSYDQPWMKETEGPGTVSLEGTQTKFKAELAEMAEQLAREPGKYGSRVSEMLAEGAELGAPATKTRVLGADVRPSELPPRMQAQLELGAYVRVTFEEAHRLRADFWDIGYKGKQIGIPDRTAAAARRIARELTLEMEKSAKARGTLEEWKAADAEWQSLKLTYDDPKSTVRKILAEPDPTKAIAVVFRNPTPHSLRLLAKEGYDLAGIKGEAIRRIQTRDFKLDGQGRLAGLPHEFLTELFGAEQLHQIYLMSDVGRTVAVKPGGLMEKISRYMQLTSVAGVPAAAMMGQPAISALATGPIAAHTVAAKVAASRALKRAVTKPTEIRAGVGLAERMKAMRAHERVWPPRPKRLPEKGAIKWKREQKPVKISEVGSDANGFIDASGDFVPLGIARLGKGWDTHITALNRAGVFSDRVIMEEKLIRVRQTRGGELDVDIFVEPTDVQVSSIAKLVRQQEGAVSIVYTLGNPEHAVYGDAVGIGGLMRAIREQWPKKPEVQPINPREAADLGVSAERVPEVLRRKMEAGSATQAAAKREPSKPSLVEKIGKGKGDEPLRRRVIKQLEEEGFGSIEAIERTQTEYKPYWNKPLPGSLQAADVKVGDIIYHAVPKSALDAVLRKGLDARKPGRTSGSVPGAEGDWMREFLESDYIRDHPPGTLYFTPDKAYAKLWAEEGNIVGVRVSKDMLRRLGTGDEMSASMGNVEYTIYGVVEPRDIISVDGKPIRTGLAEKIGKGRKRP